MTILNFKPLPGDEAYIAKMDASKRDLLTTTEKYEEVAKRLRVPVGTVKSRTHRARAELIKRRKGEWNAKKDESQAQPQRQER